MSFLDSHTLTSRRDNDLVILAHNANAFKVKSINFRKSKRSNLITENLSPGSEHNYKFCILYCY